ncbi:unannotated protein [freshwater metagenome]|uniref:Unannotated protein n=1 Tax=freshwater metagenome TaxID=449393 RepID=A0A6J7I5Y7_9ZZZZ
MGTDERIVEIGVEYFSPGDPELGPDEHREEATAPEQDESHDEVLDADDLVVGRVLPVLPLALTLAGHVLGIVMGDVVAEHPAERPGKGADADHEPDNPSDVGRADERIEAHLRVIGVLGAPWDQLRSNGVGHDREHEAQAGAGEDVRPVQESAGLAVLLGLRHGRLLEDIRGLNRVDGAHTVLFPPISRTQASNCSWVTTLICVSI